MAKQPDLTIISLGGGVQSSVMALMAAQGEIKPMPDYAIFADTGWEPEAVYSHLDWLETQCPYPLERVRAGNIRKNIISGINSEGGKFISIPAFSVNKDGKPIILTRQCTREYKIDPIQQRIRQLLGLKPRQRVKPNTWVVQWMGISLDEVIRMKPSRWPYIEHQWPLVNDVKMTREDCKEWFARRYPTRPLQRSACIGCPYHSDVEWQNMKVNDPKSFADAVFLDNHLRAHNQLGRDDGQMYLHRSRQPLGEVDFSHRDPKQPELWGEECEGMCGV